MVVRHWLKAPLLTPWRLRLLSFTLLGVAFVLLLALKALPYSSCRLTAINAEELRRRPTPDFGLGPLTWRVSEWKKSPALEAFRDTLRSDCGTVIGVTAATCAAKALAHRSPIGNPSIEFVDRDFDPSAHFASHMAGEPGHCLTRSAIVATQLLATGIPARVVQMIPQHSKGHTVLEVWDEALGWTVIDPTSGGIVTSQRRQGSAADLLATPSDLQWTPIPSAAFPPNSQRTQKSYYESVLRGVLVYPEPWLYLRIGERVAPWPFLGQFVRVGPSFPDLGPAQSILIWLIPGLGVAGLGISAISASRLTVTALDMDLRHLLLRTLFVGAARSDLVPTGPTRNAGAHPDELPSSARGTRSPAALGQHREKG